MAKEEAIEVQIVMESLERLAVRKEYLELELEALVLMFRRVYHNLQLLADTRWGVKRDKAYCDVFALRRQWEEICARARAKVAARKAEIAREMRK